MTNTLKDQTAQSIVSGAPGRKIAPMTVIDQIGITTRMRIGYIPSSLMYSKDYIKFQVSLDRKPRRWVIVKLDASDTYSIEFGRLVKKFYWTIDAQFEGIYGDALGAVIERVFEEVYS